MQLSNIGPIKQLTVPPSWEKMATSVALPNHMQLPVFIFRPRNAESLVEMGIFFRGRMESEKDGLMFRDLLLRHQDIREKTALMPQEIKDLVHVLDLTGFNQYSFPQEKSGYPPDFHLRSAELVPLNGKIVLKVVGDFVTTGVVDAYYYGIYIDADGSGRKVYEVFLRAGDKQEFMRSLTAYKAALSTISWR